MSAVFGRRVIAGPAGRLKYANKPTDVDGRKFASKKEARRYEQLRLLEKNGELRNLILQKTFRLEVNGVLICKYRADFVYEELRGGEWLGITEDVKGYKTPLYLLKKKMMKACLGIDIRET